MLSPREARHWSGSATLGRTSSPADVGTRGEGAAPPDQMNEACTLGCRPSAPPKPTPPRDVLSARSLVIHENQQQTERILDRPWLGLAGTGGSVGFLKIFIGDSVRFCGSAKFGQFGSYGLRFAGRR